MNTIKYYLLYAIVYLLSILPFWLLYVISDFNYLIFYRLVGYRRKIVRKNLRNSFPEKTESELKAIEKKFYHWFCDYIFETFQLISISDKKLLKHMEYRGLEQLEECFDRKQDTAVILGHYCNWEWMSSIGLGFKRYPEAVVNALYHKLKSPSVDRLFLKIRKAKGCVPIEKSKILRHLLKWKMDDTRYMTAYISDQGPRWHNIHLWIDFMNQNTPVFTGGERLMRKMNNAVFYIKMERPKRGKYIATFIPITYEPNKLPEFEITKRFFKMLEDTIKEHPEFYLWSHNRWKRTKEKYDQIMAERKRESAERMEKQQTVNHE